MEISESLKLLIKKKLKKRFIKKTQLKYKAMLYYCLNCRTLTENKNPKAIKTKIERILLL